MAWTNYILYFIIGGLITTAIVGLEESGMPLLSRLATLFPVFTWLSYLFLSQLETPEQIASHAKFVLFGTIVAWIPYMISLVYFLPKLGVYKSILLSMFIFMVIALAFAYIYPKL